MGQMFRGRVFSASGMEPGEPPQRPRQMPPAATISSSGTNTQNVPTTGAPFFLASRISAILPPWISAIRLSK